MPSDPSIYGLIQQQPGPLDQYGKVLNLKALMGQNQLQGLQTEKLTGDMAEETAAKNYLKGLAPGVDPTSDESISGLQRVAPNRAMQFRKDALATRETQGKIAHTAAQTGEITAGHIAGAWGALAQGGGSDESVKNAEGMMAPLLGPEKAAAVTQKLLSMPPETRLAYAVAQAGAHKTGQEALKLFFQSPDSKATNALRAANEPFSPGPNGPVANVPVQTFQLDKAKKSAPVTNVSLSTEKKYGEQFAGEMAKADAVMRDTALKAPDLAQRANQIKEVLSSGKIITGSGADYRLALGKALNVAGLNDGETVANTETLATQLARNTLDAIKASGLGSGSGFSNADRDFLEKAVGGKLSLQPETIDRLATLAHRTAEQSARKWGDRVKNIPSDALKGTGLDVEQINVPPLFKTPVKASGPQSNIRSQADAILENRTP